METLLPCPFCGGEVVGVQEDKILLNGHRYWRIYHLNPDCTLTDSFGKVMLDSSYSTREKAVAAWNRRAPDIVYCRECQYYRDLMCWHHTEPCTNAKGYKGEAVCVEPDDFCSCGVRREPCTP